MLSCVGYAYAATAPVQWMGSGLKVSAFRVACVRRPAILSMRGKFGGKWSGAACFGGRVIDGGRKAVPISGLDEFSRGGKMELNGLA